MISKKHFVVFKNVYIHSTLTELATLRMVGNYSNLKYRFKWEGEGIKTSDKYQKELTKALLYIDSADVLQSVLISVCTTLLKQAFAFVKSGLKDTQIKLRKTYNTLIKIYLFF